MGEVRREHWATKIGLILAMAGNAVGLGNFIRFPAKAAAYGGGAYLIPYFLALVLLGIPIMFVEWTLGRHGGLHGHGHLAPMMYIVSKKKLSPKSAATFAIIGGAVAFVTGVMITGYYTNIIGWMGYYSVASLTGQFSGLKTADDAGAFFVNFLTNPALSLTAWLISLFIMISIVSRGVRRGIEIAAKIMMPTLFIEGIILVVLSLTLGAPIKPEWSSLRGFEWLWTPKLEKLSNPATFIEGAGQIFFTLSIGIAGIIPNYASYLRREEDLPLSALTTTSLNEFAEVVMGASIAIPLAYAFGGPDFIALVEAGKISGFGVAISALPPLFGRLGAVGAIGGFLWFSLLWFAGVTSAIALINVLITIFVEDFKLNRVRGALIAFIIIFITGVFVNIEAAMKTQQLTDYLDLADFYAGSLLLLVVALFEVVAALWLWGVDDSYEELHRGAYMTVPKWYWKYVTGIISPLYLLILLGWFIYTAFLKGEVVAAARPDNVFGWIGVAMIIIMFIVGLIINYKALKNRYPQELGG
ncbi:sodium:neurotransmitter symporter [Staphylothermus marinus F1]|uniref:Sodium:neurotransmitter symporter n=1 Tax=Staphylothermus marinus (strain ATCC 43588 / DSM 3639 / JCM 9404 / F1) TaxID=399550 RepID=A3DL88_STAMF|nr:sodium-dependent transporter [Staphylothermus marinus]ABN69398.1 sodium:neurotransmitter symporter [Staphylothermus marinus F1]